MERRESSQDQDSGSEEVHRTSPYSEGLRQACCCLGKSSVGDKLRSWNPTGLYFHPSLLSGDPSEQLVRHFLIETGPKGVKIKGCPTEPYFGEKQDSEEDSGRRRGLGGS